MSYNLDSFTSKMIFGDFQMLTDILLVQISSSNLMYLLTKVPEPASVIRFRIPLIYTEIQPFKFGKFVWSKNVCPYFKWSILSDHIGQIKKCSLI